ncbi:FAD-dependent oxidoreductase [Mycobacterium persicum]|uniref:FAD-dependent oxidoreductase n=1 Tax=Mycobacterium persicum TaxID=1487726 RepID=A0A8E2IPV9_9MYCO|nr:NAD(P)/FAD-dependent oxidoreductase [Mycobacterium persicum]KZS85567.1 FAD-dependent oxidoreductase [Mycobacterium persicum]ORB94525.1 FAD-dependent oxidoreductase [Mycobacterium persicum]ORC06613.1 FAD-dependent oxidoreductase [Mycobacterium persicum]VAZ78829.1 putative oxidoreductase CzcO [Mycobacterium persicum]VAZ98264.1 putative oxidoreductase CzcO [Mycobacterium persicum]
MQGNPPGLVVTGAVERPVVVVGAGPAGVSMALSLRDCGLRPLLVDRSDAVGSSWRGRYDRLKLNTCKQFSHLPDRPYLRNTPVFPTRDQVVDHLERHACEAGIELRLNTEVCRIDRRHNGWWLRTTAGTIDCQQVVIATGYEHTPRIPRWPGIDGFAGQLLHSAAYRNPAPYQGKRVLVVGAGSSAMEIVHDVATGGAAKAWLAVPTTPNIMLRSLPGGLPADLIATPLFHAPVWLADRLAAFGRRLTIGDLSAFGLPVPAEGVFARGIRLGRAPAIVDKEVIQAIRDGSFEVVPTIERFDGASVWLANGQRLQPDAVICATGYLHGLEPMVGHLGVLDERGLPRTAGVTPADTGLRFIGFQSRPGLLGFVAKQSKHVAKRVAAELESSASYRVH